jgi:hypothetical protein
LFEAWEAENREDYNRRIDMLIVGSITCIHIWSDPACYLDKWHYEFGKHSNRPKEFRPEFYKEVNTLLRSDPRFASDRRKEL